jgi:prefoldin subunit 5
MARGEEQRDLVLRELRKMRDSFDAALRAWEEALAEAEARAATLEEELHAVAARRARRSRRTSS